jgi:formylglycine-generating enzyme required for sulfatase activity
VWSADGSFMRGIVCGGHYLYVDLRPVTNGDFTLFIRDLLPDLQLPQEMPVDFRFAPAGAEWNAKERLDQPVIDVAWFAAAMYARAVGKTLPTDDAAFDIGAEMTRAPEEWIGAWGRAFTDKRPATPFAVEMGRQLRCVISGPAAG